MSQLVVLGPLPTLWGGISQPEVLEPPLLSEFKFEKPEHVQGSSGPGLSNISWGPLVLHPQAPVAAAAAAGTAGPARGPCLSIWAPLGIHARGPTGGQV